MAGGQGGQSWLGENNIWIAGLTLFACVVVGIVGCDDVLDAFQQDPTPYEQWLTEDCEAASVSNDPDAEAKAIAADPDCKQHMTMVRQTEALEDQSELQEAQQP